MYRAQNVILELCKNYSSNSPQTFYKVRTDEDNLFGDNKDGNNLGLFCSPHQIFRLYTLLSLPEDHGY